MNKALKKDNTAVKANLKTIIKSFDDLQTTLNLSPQDADSKQIVKALKYISSNLDNPDFPNAEDQKIINTAIKLAIQTGNDSGIDLQDLYEALKR